MTWVSVGRNGEQVVGWMIRGVLVEGAADYTGKILPFQTLCLHASCWLASAAPRHGRRPTHQAFGRTGVECAILRCARVRYPETSGVICPVKELIAVEESV